MQKEWTLDAALSAEKEAMAVVSAGCLYLGSGSQFFGVSASDEAVRLSEASDDLDPSHAQILHC